MFTPRVSLLALLAACHPDPAGKPGAGDSGPAGAGPDVSERLGPGEVRAGVIADGEALFGGVSAEGRPGDVKIYNHRVQFIVQGVRDGSYYEACGGGIVDADVVRPEGEPGRDVLDELWVMVGLGRIACARSVTVLSDGTDGAPAVVRVTADAAPLALITGALEAPTFVDDRQMEIVSDYTLAPDSWLLQAETRVTWQDEGAPVQVGDVSMVGMEVVDTVRPGPGLDGGPGRSTGDWVAVLGKNNEVAVGLFRDEERFVDGAVATILAEVGPVIAGFGATVTPADGDVLTWRRFIGVGPDLATLTGAWRAARGDATALVGGSVTADGAPVAGARVHLRDGDALETIAVTDAEGGWSAYVEGADTAIATGRGAGNIVDLPSGAGWIAPYAHEVPAALALDTLAAGATPIPMAEGFGISAPAAAAADTALSLTAPGTLRVAVADGGPAVVRVDFAAGDPVAADPGLVPGRPSGALLYGYVRDGDLDLPVEPGDYTVTVHRGLRYEPVVESISVESGGTATVEADLALVVAPSGVLAGDPHAHAAPSGDGEIAMSHRLLVHAGHGVQVHFGTDHDHVADYRPLLAPLAIDDWMTSILADEVSPVLRGHTNVYPVPIALDSPNHGAWRWWDGVDTTDAYYAELRAWIGEDAILQLNHPDGSSGMLGIAGYQIETGRVGRPDHFSDAFDAMEVLNDGNYGDFLPYYLDLVARGYTPTPTGVSDAHGYRNGSGENLTFLDVGVDDPTELTDALLVEAMKAHRTVVSRGPYLDATVDGAWAPGQTFTGAVTLEVDVLAPSFVVIDTLDLVRDGEVVESRPWTGAAESFALPEDADGSYVVVAHGAQSMAPVFPGQTPWAMTAAVRVDLGGDGWDAPKPGLILGNQ